MHYAEGDVLHLETRLVGSQHLAHGFRAHTNRTQQPGRMRIGDQHSVDYKRYYRPTIRLLQRRTTSDGRVGPYEVQKWNHPLETTFILPTARTIPQASESGQSVDAFHGRRMSAQVNFPLIRDWVKKCASTHNSPRGTHFSTRCGDFDTDTESARHQMFVSLLSKFRFVDARSGCIVRVDQPIRYAALNYVWGTPNAYCSMRRAKQSCQLPASSLPAMRMSQRQFVMLSWLQSIFPFDTYGLMRCAYIKMIPNSWRSRWTLWTRYMGQQF